MPLNYSATRYKPITEIFWLLNFKLPENLILLFGFYIEADKKKRSNPKNHSHFGSLLLPLESQKSKPDRVSFQISLNPKFIQTNLSNGF